VLIGLSTLSAYLFSGMPENHDFDLNRYTPRCPLLNSLKKSQLCDPLIKCDPLYIGCKNVAHVYGCYQICKKCIKYVNLTSKHNLNIKNQNLYHC